MDINRNRKTIASDDKSVFNELSIICGCETISTLQDRRCNPARSYCVESLLRCTRNRYAIITVKNCQYFLPVIPPFLTNKLFNEMDIKKNLGAPNTHFVKLLQIHITYY